MGTKIDRAFYYIFLALVNIGVIWFTLSTSTTVADWVYAILIVAAVIEDALIFGWATDFLPNYGATGENSVAGIWSVGQIVQLGVLAILAGLQSVAIGVIVAVLSAVWIYWRGKALNKVMDLRYW
jgi:hypothetical protein